MSRSTIGSPAGSTFHVLSGASVGWPRVAADPAFLFRAQLGILMCGVACLLMACSGDQPIPATAVENGAKLSRSSSDDPAKVPTENMLSSAASPDEEYRVIAAAAVKRITPAEGAVCLSRQVEGSSPTELTDAFESDPDYARAAGIDQDYYRVARNLARVGTCNIWRR
ncbi:MAG: hypothetical protein ACXW27_10885 [Allosphingosinicella sp.]